MFEIAKQTVGTRNSSIRVGLRAILSRVFTSNMGADIHLAQQTAFADPHPVGGNLCCILPPHARTDGRKGGLACCATIYCSLQTIRRTFTTTVVRLRHTTSSTPIMEYCRSTGFICSLTLSAFVCVHTAVHARTRINGRNRCLSSSIIPLANQTPLDTALDKATGPAPSS